MANDCGSFRSSNSDLILDTVVIRRPGKRFGLYEIGKLLEQTGNPKEDLPNEINSFAFALTGLVAEKTSKLQFQLTFMPKESQPSCSFSLEVTYTATSEIKSLHQGGQP